MNTLSRRRFLGATLVGMGIAAVPSRAWSVIGANERINIALVGCGWRGGQLLNSFKRVSNASIVSLCDPDEARMDQLAQELPNAERHRDMRHVLDNKDVDAVVIANNNHWHCLAAIWSLDAGKHVYVEKPLCHTQWEGRQLINAVRNSGQLCQVGTQQRSDPMQAEIKDLLHAEQLLGEIQSVQVHRFGVRKPIGKRRSPLQPPTTLDYDLWLGPAEDLPIYRDEFHYDWHWDWNTGSGEMGNWGVHLVDDVRNNVFQDRIAFPQTIAAAGGRYVWNDAGNTPNLQLTLLDTGGIPVSIAVCNLPMSPNNQRPPSLRGYGSGYTVSCAGGRLEARRGMAVAYDEQGRVIRQLRGDSGACHQQNFVESVRENAPGRLTAPVEVGYHSTSWCNLANIATRVTERGLLKKGPADSAASSIIADEVANMKKLLADYQLAGEASDFDLGRPLRFDAQRQHFTGEEAEVANQFLQRSDRRHFQVPEVGANAMS